jgi:hypothetical protein
LAERSRLLQRACSSDQASLKLWSIPWNGFSSFALADRMQYKEMVDYLVSSGRVDASIPLLGITLT